MIPFFDLHCDTFLKMYNEGQKIKDNTLHISLDKARNLLPYIQICAIWSDCCLTNDEAFFKCLAVTDYLKKQNISLATDLKGIKNYGFILGIEDARLLNGDLSRLNALYMRGARVLTLNWRGNSIIGGGFDTSNPLTAFGKSVIRRCKELGIVVDLSHSSQQVFNEVIKLAEIMEFTPIASHSNSFSICNHSRNLTDAQFKELMNFKSIIGISFVPEHLGECFDTDAIIRHISHFLQLGGENNIAFGSDFDGVDALPQGIDSIASISSFYCKLIQEFGKAITDKICFENAYSFFKRNL